MCSSLRAYNVMKQTTNACFHIRNVLIYLNSGNMNSDRIILNKYRPR